MPEANISTQGHGLENMKEKKYKLTDDTIISYDHILHRIEAVRDFAYVMLGDKGGYVESEDNLSHDGNCWVYDDARVMDQASVYGDASVREHAFVAGQSQVCGEAVFFVCTRNKHTSVQLYKPGNNGE